MIFYIVSQQKNDNLLLKIVVLFGGRRWIRTIEAESNRFTVCPLWPLGNSPILNFNLTIKWSWWTDDATRLRLAPKVAATKKLKTCHRQLFLTLFALSGSSPCIKNKDTSNSKNSRTLTIKWSWWTDSNPRPADYKSAALPTELHQLIAFFCNIDIIS